MRRSRKLTAVPQFGAAVLAEVLRRQPLTPGKVSLAWQMAAGPGLARAADAAFEEPDTIRVRPKDARWAAEIHRSRDMLAERLNALLGVPNLRLEIV
jgi:hypothetical protein